MNDDKSKNHKQCYKTNYRTKLSEKGKSKAKRSRSIEFAFFLTLRRRW